MPKGVPGSKAPHGTLTRYTCHGCRCEECREAHRAYQRAKYGKPGRPRDVYLAEVTRHGWGRYKSGGCRCDVCRAAAAAQKRRQRANNAEHYRAYYRARYEKKRGKP